MNHDDASASSSSSSSASSSQQQLPRRDFLRLSVATVGALGAGGAVHAGDAAAPSPATPPPPPRPITPGRGLGGQRMPMPLVARYNGQYSGARLNRVAFPMGGIGAGMICLEGTGTLSHVSLRNKPEVFNQPCVFAAVCIKGSPNIARVLEGPVPGWKLFGSPGTGNGAAGATYGFPRFARSQFTSRFPFGTVSLLDPKVPLQVELTGWSPFEPGDVDNASLPVAGLEYRFTNRGPTAVEAVFSFNAKNFMARGDGARGVKPSPNGGFVLWSAAGKDKGWEEGSFSATVADPGVKVNHNWFRGGWWDDLTMAWKEVEEGNPIERPPVGEGGASPGASLFVPFSVPAGGSKTIVLRLAWHVAQTNLRIGKEPETEKDKDKDKNKPASSDASTYKPWYAGKFANIDEVTAYWATHYDALRAQSSRFKDCLYESTLPPEVIDAVAANLTILKSPTVMRQADGRLWSWEGCGDNDGCCHGSCTHVWNYAQAIPHLFPALERTLRETEFGPSQDERGHQTFRTNLPIRPVVHDFHAAADGQLGGIMKAHREWRISGNTEWLRGLWPKIKASLDYCIQTWDPDRKGWTEEPHHNTYDIEFWGPDGMCTSFYIGALAAAVEMGKAVGADTGAFAELLQKGRQRMESELYDGEYFIQKIEWKNLKAKNPQEVQSFGGGYSPEAKRLLDLEGPKYQYGKGCLSDGVLGAWLARVCGLGDVLDGAKIASHLVAIHRHNLKRDLSAHANPQRPSYAAGNEGGLLLCTWPKGGALSLPFVYSNEVWTGIEYQVASHLMLMGEVDRGLEIVRVCRDRYDGRVRNPFNEYECGHWYARAMSSYGLLQGLTGARYDAVDKVLHVQPSIAGDFKSFFSAEGGYGIVGVKDGKAFFEPRGGKLEIKEIKHTPKAAAEKAA